MGLKRRIGCCIRRLSRGKSVTEQYSLETLLQKGHGGGVYLGKDGKGQEVVIKMIKSTEHSKNEMRISKRVRGSSCIETLDCFEDLGYTYIIMPFMEAGDLFDHIFAKADPTSAHFLDWFTAIGYFAQILQGLHQIHSSGYVHGDIKLENIYMTKNKHLKIGDFGRSRAFSWKKKELFEAGSLMYTPPECHLGIPIYGPEMDVWCLGVCLYIMLTGRFPFGWNTEEEALNNICNHPMAKVMTQILPKEVECLLESLLDKDPRRRPTVQQLLGLRLLHP